MANLERDGAATVLESEDSEQEPSDHSQVEPKQLEINKLNYTQGLLIANGALRNCELENNKQGQRNVALVSSLPDQRLTDIKTAECFLFNKLTASMPGEIKLSDHKLTNGCTVEDLSIVERLNLNNKEVDIMDTKLEDSGLNAAKSTEASLLDKSTNVLQGPLVDTENSSRSCCFESREEFRFLLMPDFLILSVSFLFMAAGCSSPVVYLVPYALSTGVEHKQAAFLMSIFGVCGIVGNITFGWITDRT